jgi:hypothetical protein
VPNTSIGIVPTLKFHRDAKADLDAIWDSDPDAAATITTLLQEAKTNQSILDSFSCQDFGLSGFERYHVTQWFEQQRKGRNLWRLKVWELEGEWPLYRVIYAFHPLTHIYYVLGVFKRDFNYDETDPRTQRVLAVYDRLGIPVYK